MGVFTEVGSFIFVSDQARLRHSFLNVAFLKQVFPGLLVGGDASA